MDGKPNNSLKQNLNPTSNQVTRQRTESQVVISQFLLVYMIFLSSSRFSHSSIERLLPLVVLHLLLMHTLYNGLSNSSMSDSFLALDSKFCGREKVVHATEDPLSICYRGPQQLCEPHPSQKADAVKIVLCGRERLGFRD